MLHIRLPIQQIKPYLKCPTKPLQKLTLPNQKPHKIKPGIWVKLPLGEIESKVRPKSKPTFKPLIDPWIIDQGNNQNNGQYGWVPKIPSQLGCHKKTIGIKTNEIRDKFFFKNWST